MKRFLAVIPPYVLDRDGQAIVPKKAMLPVGVLSVAAALIDRGCDVQVVDLVFSVNWAKALSDRLGSHFDRILVCCHTVRNIPVCTAVTEIIRREAPTSHIVIGGNIGVELSLQGLRELGLKADALVRGYGHSLAVIESLIRGELGDISGSTDANLPTPAVGLLSDDTRAAYLKRSGGQYPMVTTQFGCRWNCGYCSARMRSPCVRRDSAEVIRELDQAVAQGYRKIWAVDNIVTTDAKALRLLDQACTTRGLTWMGMTRPEQAAQQAGLLSRLSACSELALGIESTDQTELDVYGRRAGADYNRSCFHAVRNIRTAGIKSTGFVMLGGPKSTLSSALELYDALQSLGLDSVSWAFYNPPASEVSTKQNAADYGFYRWPLVGSMDPVEVVQVAMMISATWWGRMKLAYQPLVREKNWFGLRLADGRLFGQDLTARSPEGNLWQVWDFRA